MITPPSARILTEWLLRAVATGLIAVLLWRSLDPPRAARIENAVSADLSTLVRRWTVAGAPDSAAIVLQSVPDGLTRDWLVALRRGGMKTTWSSTSLVPALMSAEPVIDPAGGVMVRVGAPSGVTLTLEDEGGVVDTGATRRGTTTFRLAALAGDPRIAARGQILTTPLSDSVRLGRVLVLGRVGWEAKFAVAALEERGWRVDARLVLAPGQAVSQGTVGLLDTTRYSAVVVLDSAAVTDPAALVRYVSDGGGLVVAGGAARASVFGPVLPGRAGARIVPRQRLTDTTEGGGARFMIAGLRSDAIVLERDDTVVTVAARRVGGGRVIQLADEESWRRRMSKTQGSVERHREWWARVVGSVAHASRTEVRPRGTEAAPVANLIAALGPPTVGLAVSDPRGAPGRRRDPETWMFATIAIALLAEWGSRRWRGAA